MAGPSQITDEKARAAIRAWVEQQHGELDRSSYYHLLQVPPTAFLEQIRTAYYALVARLHPDLYVGTLDPVTRGKLISIYSRLVEGYQVLSDGKRRALYDQNLRAGKLRLTPEDERPQKRPGGTMNTGMTMQMINNEHARRFFKLGQEALRSGNKPAAQQNLKLALQAEPGNPLIQALLQEAGGAPGAARPTPTPTPPPRSMVTPRPTPAPPQISGLSPPSRPPLSRPAGTSSSGMTAQMIHNDQARRLFKLGQDALRQGNRVVAQEHLNLALQAEPGNAFILALLNEARRGK